MKGVANYLEKTNWQKFLDEKFDAIFDGISGKMEPELDHLIDSPKIDILDIGIEF